MIHALLFLAPEGGKHDRSGHGEDFKSHMSRINKLSGANITVSSQAETKVIFLLCQSTVHKN